MQGRLRAFLRSHDLWAALFLLAFFAVQYRAVLFQGRHWLFLDNGWQNYPWHYWVWQHARQGGLTDPCLGMSLGFPLYAEPQAQCFYPFNTAWWPIGDPLVSFTAKLALHLLGLMFGVYVLARGQRFSPLASAAAAVVVSAGGFMATHIVHAPIVTSVAWTPWIIALFLRTLRTGSRPAFVGMALTVAMQLLAGQPQMSLYTALACLLLSPFHLPDAGGSRLGRGLRPIGLIAGAWGLGAVMAIVQLAPAYEMYLYGWRTLPDLTFVRMFGATCRDLGVNFLGGLNVDFKLEKTAFPGSLALLAMLYGVLFVRGARARGWAVVALVGLLGAWAADNPLYTLVPHVPIINHFRAPSRVGLLFTLAAALLLAEFLEACPHERRRRLAGVAVGTVALLEAVAWATTGRLGLGPLSASDPLGWQLVVLLGALALAAVTRPDSRPRRLLRPALLVLVGAELLYFGGNVFPTYTTREWLADANRGIYELAARHAHGDGTAFVRWHDGSPDNIALVYGLPQARCFTAMASPGMDAVSTWLYGPNSPAFLAAYGVRWVGSPRDWGERAGLQPVDAVGEWVLFRNPLPVAPAYMPDRLLPLGALEATAFLPKEGVDPRHTAALPPELLGSQPRDCPGATVTAEASNSTRLVLRTRAPAPGAVIATRLWTPHWSATVDGQPAPCFPANLILLATAVPAGEHVVQFDYVAEVRVPGLVSLFTVLGALVWLGVAVGQDRRAPLRAA